MRVRVFAVFAAFFVACSSVFSYQTTPKAKPEPEISEVIRRFAEAESRNKIAQNNYTFTQEVTFLTIGEAGSITGKYHRVSDIVYDDLGKRFEKITFFPIPTTQSVTAEDIQDFGGVQPFAFNTEDLPKYQVDYVGKEKIDELNLYVFQVKPIQMRKGERYLDGKIWVDDQDLQIVKVAGRAVPQFDHNKFPHFETYRENIDGRYWFPTYSYADDVLEFKKGPPLHVRMTIRYTNYKKFSGRIRLTDEGEAVSEDDAKSMEKAKPAPKPVKPPEPETKPDPKTKRP